jgi:hypothetical protein
MSFAKGVVLDDLMIGTTPALSSPFRWRSFISRSVLDASTRLSSNQLNFH